MSVAIVPTLDSIATFELLTNAMDARYGNQNGGQITMTTRRGAITCTVASSTTTATGRTTRATTFR